MSELKTNKISTNDQNNVAIDNALGLKSYTTTQRDALTSAAGDMIYNTTTSKVEAYTGSAWVSGLQVATIQSLVIAGGGGGGSGGGGGGAGGYLNTYASENTGGGIGTLEDLIVKLDGTTTYTVTVGAGGSAGTGGGSATTGGISQFSTYIASGGGKGGGYNSTTDKTGGSGGGAGSSGNFTGFGGGNYAQGFRGGVNRQASNFGSGGGGGASETGYNPPDGNTAGDGGDGLASLITGSSVTRAGGGGGGGNSNNTTAGSGGAGGGGNGSVTGTNNGSAGTVNTGGGGGGSSHIGGSSFGTGGAGGSGIVILRWATADATIGATRTGLTDGGVQTDGSDSYIVFTAGTGTITFS